MKSSKEKFIKTKLYLAALSKIAHKGLGVEDLDKMVERVIAAGPLMGVLVPGGCGIRKLRIPLPGRGKSGGCRVIYYFYNNQEPIVLLDIYAKNDKENVTAQDRSVFAYTIREIKKTFSK